MRTNDDRVRRLAVEIFRTSDVDFEQAYLEAMNRVNAQLRVQGVRLEIDERPRRMVGFDRGRGSHG